MRQVQIFELMMALILLLASCVQSATPAPALKPAVTTVAPGKAAWEEQWETTVTAARREGIVSILSSAPIVSRGLNPDVFREKYGIEIEAFVGTLGEMWTKAEAERRNGLYLRDIVMAGVIGGMKDTFGTVADPMEPAFILPEVKDPNAWQDKGLPFFDKERKLFMYLSRVGNTLVINKELVKPEELRSWRNLLEPKWKGKILIFDPSITGAGNTIIAAVAEIMGVDYLKELAKQEPAINRDKRLQVEWVAKGKYPIGVGFEAVLVEDMRGAGAPLALLVPSEGTFFGSGAGGIVLLSRPPHPNAAKVFTNWFLSREGQTLMARAAKEQSRRVDVAPELPPDRLFEQGIKYIDADTDYMFDKRNEMLKLSKEIFVAQYR